MTQYRKRKGSKGEKSFPIKTPRKQGDIGDRIDVSYDVLGHPQQREKPVEEGNHYTVLAYTDWADQFIPTVIKWNHGEIDNFTDRRLSVENRLKAIHHR